MVLCLGLEVMGYGWYDMIMMGWDDDDYLRDDEMDWNGWIHGTDGTDGIDDLTHYDGYTNFLIYAYSF